MAQTAPPLPGEGRPRPLPRGGRLASRNTRPRFQAIDTVWLLFLAGSYAGLTYAEWGLRHAGLFGMLAGAAAVALTYLLGWRASGRPAGIAAALLLATSAPFLQSPEAGWTTGMFALVTLASLFAFVAGSSLIALGLAVAAAWMRPEGALLGLMLLALSLGQHRRRALWGAALFLLPVAAQWVFLLTAGHRQGPPIHFGLDFTLPLWLVTPAAAFISWFLLPFCGELGDPQRRARWLPILLWTALILALNIVTRPGGASAALTPFLPLWFLLIGGGLARLLPSMTGDIPAPTLRYVLATVAVVGLVALHVWAERTPGRPLSVIAVPAVVHAPSDVSPPSAPAAHPVSPRAAVLPVVKPPPTPLRTLAHKPDVLPASPQIVPAANHPAVVKPKSTKPVVRLYTVRNGQLVRRSKWAIQWDLTHSHR